VPDRAELKRLRQVRRRLRNRQRKQARRLLDDAYQAYRLELSEHSQKHTDDLQLKSTQPADPPASPVPEPPLSPRPNSPPPEPDSPHSVLTLRVRPDTPPPTPSISPPSYSPISSPKQPPRTPSPANSTASSVEFIQEIHIPLLIPDIFIIMILTYLLKS